MYHYKYSWFGLFLILQLNTLGVAGQDCDLSTERQVVVEIRTDFRGDQTSWELLNFEGQVIAHSELGAYRGNRYYRHEWCVDLEDCLIFTIRDSGGDGILGQGYFRVLSGQDTLVRSRPFTNEISAPVFCPPGLFCDNPIVIREGPQMVSKERRWFLWTAEHTGKYKISTCAATCDTRIHLYLSCPKEVSNNPEGTLIYSDSDGECGERAVARGILERGKKYLLFIDADCGSPFEFDLEYEGPYAGCTDPESCNFHPLAVVDDGSCLARGHPDCPAAPDLAIDQNRFLETLALEKKDAGNNSCALKEGCFNGSGEREVIVFSTRIFNIGNAHYYLGPSDDNEDIIYDSCHQHSHYEGYAEYILYDEEGRALPASHKTGFCLLDLDCGPGEGIYTCDNMGLSPGCADEYDESVDCQWIDITDVPEGKYVLVNRINWNNRPDALNRVEQRLDNNWAQACIEIKRNREGEASIFLLEDCPLFVDCAGVALGLAERDCSGLCGGSAIPGDWTFDGIIDEDDLEKSLGEVLEETVPFLPCYDLFANGRLDLLDVFWLSECIHANSVSVESCRSSYDQETLTDQVSLVAGLDIGQRYIDLAFNYTGQKAKAIWLQVGGVTLISAQALPRTVSDQSVVFNDNGDVIIFSHNGSIPSSQYVLRLYFRASPGMDACIDIFETVSTSGDWLSKRLSPCIENVARQNNEPFNLVRVFPNPVEEEVFFEFYSGLGSGQLRILDSSGREWLSTSYLPQDALSNAVGLPGNPVSWDTSNVPAGLYFYQYIENNIEINGQFIVK